MADWEEEQRIHFIQMLMIFLSPLQNKAFDPKKPPDFMTPVGMPSHQFYTVLALTVLTLSLFV